MSAFNYAEAKQKLLSSPDLCFDPVTCSMALQQLALKKKGEWIHMLDYVMQKGACRNCVFEVSGTCCSYQVDN